MACCFIPYSGAPSEGIRYLKPSALGRHIIIQNVRISCGFLQDVSLAPASEGRKRKDESNIEFFLILKSCAVILVSEFKRYFLIYFNFLSQECF